MFLISTERLGVNIVYALTVWNRTALRAQPGRAVGANDIAADDERRRPWSDEPDEVPGDFPGGMRQ